jgi:hypothetical protein
VGFLNRSPGLVIFLLTLMFSAPVYAAPPKIVLKPQKPLTRVVVPSNAFKPVMITTATLSVVALTPAVNTLPFSHVIITTPTLSITALTPVPNTSFFTPVTITTTPLTVVVIQQ